jgi:exodeoxyribonuclease V beta subunit
MVESSAGRSDAPAFSISDPLPTGVLAVEASAGTGKTYTLAALAVRAVAEGRAAAAQLLVVTFTRAAAAELRHRVRLRLADTAAALADPDSCRGSDDPLLAHLADATADEVDERRRRVERAVAEFDSATVTTIHGFALQALRAMGVSAGGDAGARLVDDTDDRLAEVCADLLVDEGLRMVGDLPTARQVAGVARVKLALPGLVVRPRDDDEPSGGSDFGDKERNQARLAEAAAGEVLARRRRAGTMAYDDILDRLDRAVATGSSAPAASHLRTRYRVVLVDEFQDTDPIQWRILSTLFIAPGGGPAPLVVLVGDPKQAIYSFRGADVRTYLEAVHGDFATPRRCLVTNWRSDDAALGAVRALFDGVTFGDPRIRFEAVATSERMRGRRMTVPVDGRGPADLPGLQLRVVDPVEAELGKQGELTSGAAERLVMADMASRVRELVGSASLPDGDGQRPLSAGDVAVLVRTATEAEAALASLRREGVPAVLARSGSVLESRAAEQWRWLLEAVARPSDVRRARTAGVSWFGGFSADGLDAAGDEGLEVLQSFLAELGDVLLRRGAAAFVEEALGRFEVAGRVLVRPDGDRALTDLLHIGEMLAVGDGRATAAGLLGRLEPEDPRDASGQDEQDDHSPDRESRRVESDEDAVQIMTVWVAKGLEFPVVCCPTLWRYGVGGKVHRRGDERTYFIHGTGTKAAKARKALADQEVAGEHLRLLYVALTRAVHHTMLWWAPVQRHARTALGRVLFARDAEGRLDAPAFSIDRLHEDVVGIPGPLAPAEVVERFGRIGALFGAGLDGVVVPRPVVTPAPVVPTGTSGPGPGSGSGTEHAGAGDPEPWSPEPGRLEVARIARLLDRRLARWSFSAIKAREVAEADPWDPTGADVAATDEQLPPDPEEVPEIGVPGADGGLAISPLAGLPGGPPFGNLVHGVLEHTDFAAADLEQVLGETIEREQSWRRVRLRPDDDPAGDEASGRDRLVAGLAAALRTPLGGPFGGLRLADVARSDRLDELGFDLLVDPAAGITDAELGRALVAHLEPGDRFHAWARSVAAGLFRVDLAGSLNGSVDAVVRVHGDHGPRFVVVDYKTNRLHDRGTPPGAGDYGQAALTAAMAHSHYPLQAVLYGVALHRYLRWRLAGYEPHRHLGGIAYLFVRGMAGPATRVEGRAPDGVCTWRPPVEAVVALSDLFDGVSGRDGGGR